LETLANLSPVQALPQQSPGDALLDSPHDGVALRAHLLFRVLLI
jgi:hypothetical protein